MRRKLNTITRQVKLAFISSLSRYLRMKYVSLTDVCDVQMPRQVISMLCNEIHQYVLASTTDPTALLRLEYWLQHTLFAG